MAQAISAVAPHTLPRFVEGMRSYVAFNSDTTLFYFLRGKINLDILSCQAR
jgi:hypothetical protein